MSGLAYSSLRVGQRYSLQNFGDQYDFEVLEIVNSSEFKLKDLHTLEIYYMSDLIKFGKGNDYSISDYN